MKRFHLSRNQIFHSKIFRLLMLGIAVAWPLLSEQTDAQPNGSTSKCVPGEVNADLIKQQPELALKITQACIEEAKTGAAKLGGKAAFSGWDMLPILKVG